MKPLRVRIHCVSKGMFDFTPIYSAFCADTGMTMHVKGDTRADCIKKLEASYAGPVQVIE